MSMKCQRIVKQSLLEFATAHCDPVKLFLFLFLLFNKEKREVKSSCEKLELKRSVTDTVCVVKLIELKNRRIVAALMT